jgi:hypothetical protein
VSLGMLFPTFRTSVLPSSSGLLDTEDEGFMILRNVDATSQSIRRNIVKDSNLRHHRCSNFVCVRVRAFIYVYILCAHRVVCILLSCKSTQSARCVRLTYVGARLTSQNNILTDGKTV